MWPWFSMASGNRIAFWPFPTWKDICQYGMLTFIPNKCPWFIEHVNVNKQPKPKLKLNAINIAKEGARVFIWLATSTDSYRIRGNYSHDILNKYPANERLDKNNINFNRIIIYLNRITSIWLHNMNSKWEESLFNFRSATNIQSYLVSILRKIVLRVLRNSKQKPEIR